MGGLVREQELILLLLIFFKKFESLASCCGVKGIMLIVTCCYWNMITFLVLTVSPLHLTTPVWIIFR